MRGTLVESFVEQLGGVGLFDRHVLAGAVVGWWHETKFDLLALSERGFAGVIDGWVENVEMLLAPESDSRTNNERKRTAAERREAYAHKVVAAIAPDFLEELAAADALKVDLDARWKELNAEPDDDGGRDEEGDGDALTGEENYPDMEKRAALAHVRKERTKASALIKRLEADFWFRSKNQMANVEEKLASRLTRARNGLVARQGERQAVLEILRNGLWGRLDNLLQKRRQELVGSYENWREKYGLSFREIEQQLKGAAEDAIPSYPWSQRSAWEAMANSVSLLADRGAISELLYSLIDAEKNVEGLIAKLSVDELLILLPMVNSRGASAVQRRPLREVVTSVRKGVAYGGRVRPGVPVVRSADLSNRELVLSGLRSAEARFSPRSRRYEETLIPEDVLFAAADGEGRTFRAAVWRGGREQATYGDNVICIRPDAKHLTADYLAAWLTLPEVQHRIYVTARSVGGIRFVNPAQLLDVDVEVPSMGEQGNFVQHLAALTRERQVRRAQLSKLRRVREILVGNLARSGG
ncbi:hypothetical protein [Streptomyces incanus]|uniref:Type I restriction modification DNA specificity domain-containing protein n=1 Tax=Streptomyces incanus TaxID=887453 RepID=A0ABW0Y323_9ACTN